MKNYRRRTSIAFLLIFIGVSVGGCSWERTRSGAPTGDSSAASLDWEGLYRGVVPCADCEGIETTIVLQRQGSYRLSASYMGKSLAPFEQQGRFAWDPAGGIVILDGLRDRPNRYLVGENHLVQLDMEGRRITGPLADRYRLAKVEEVKAAQVVALTETTWKLVELFGTPVKEAAQGKAPFIFLRSRENRFQGFGGCNTFGGSYELKEGNRIRFFGIAATLMACPDPATETELLKALNEADNYALKGDSLSLNRARMAPLARFEAAPRP